MGLGRRFVYYQYDNIVAILYPTRFESSRMQGENKFDEFAKSLRMAKHAPLFATPTKLNRDGMICRT